MSHKTQSIKRMFGRPLPDEQRKRTIKELQALIDEITSHLKDKES